MSVHYPYLYKDSGAVEIVTWADGTDEEIATMIAAADAGQIDLSDYWSIGDERTVHLDAITAGDAMTTAMAAQDVVLVLMDTGTASGYVDVNDKTVNFIVGQKDCLSEKGRIKSTNGSWETCAMRTDLNNKYYNALPDTFKNCLKQFKVITAKSGQSSVLVTTNDYVTLFALKEITGSTSGGQSTEANALVQIDFYKTASNKIKKASDSDVNWWTRSPYPGAGYLFGRIGSSGSASYTQTDSFNYIAPFMCI